MRARAVLAALATLPALAAGAALPATAAAAIAFAPCSPAGFECGSLAVPLARGAATPGTLTLRATRRLSGASPSATAVVPLAGGPGQAALPIAPDFAELLVPGLAGRDLLVFDQRGTGQSGRLRCRAVDAGAGSLAAVRACAAQIGARRTAVPHGRHRRRPRGPAPRGRLRAPRPGRRVVRDEGGDRLRGRPSPTGSSRSCSTPSSRRRAGTRCCARRSWPSPRVLRSLCSGGACRGITSDPVRDLRTLVRRVGRRALRGTYVDANGRHLTVPVGQLGLFDVLLAGDENPTLRVRPAGRRPCAPRRGDLAPILLAAGTGGRRGGTAARLAPLCRRPARGRRQRRALHRDAAARELGPPVGGGAQRRRPALRRRCAPPGGCRTPPRSIFPARRRAGRRCRGARCLGWPDRPVPDAIPAPAARPCRR